MVMATVFTPFCYFIVLQGLSALAIEPLQAARTLGASDRTIFWRVVLPSLRPAQIIAFLLSTILAVGYFITPRLIGGGNVQFVGNVVEALLDDIGSVFDASLLAFLLFVSVLAGLVAARVVMKIIGRRRKGSPVPETSPLHFTFEPKQPE